MHILETRSIRIFLPKLQIVFQPALSYRRRPSGQFYLDALDVLFPGEWYNAVDLMTM